MIDLPLPEPMVWIGSASILIALLALIPRRRRDPQRWFNYAQRAGARSRARWQCEYTARWRLLARCPERAQETDHFTPWARGGATNDRNAVAACRRHNQAKGGRLPTRWTRNLITWRRRSYWPAGVHRKPGARYRPYSQRQ